jgi:two-component sensor histidine kinase
VPAPRWTWLGRELVLGLLVPVLTLALAVIAIWIATDYLVNRHVQALAAAARDYAAARHAGGGGGGHAGWPALSDAPAELRDLAAVLADTTGELGAREAELEASLRHKELLLREVHHRVRNNLQVVTSLLNLRAQAAAAASPAARDALIEAQARVKALALVHRDLYEGDEPGAVELRSLLGELCALLEDTVSGRLTGAAAAVDVAVRVELAPARVAVDRAVPVALFLTEALSNALRHAFPGDGSGGTVSVRLVRDEAAGTAALTVEDDGIGLGSLPLGAGRVDGPGRAAAGGLGMTLMRMLAGQAGGPAPLGPAREDGTGTRVGLDFPLAAAATAARRPNGGDAPPPSGPAAVPLARGFPRAAVPERTANIPGAMHRLFPRPVDNPGGVAAGDGPRVSPSPAPRRSRPRS